MKRLLIAAALAASLTAGAAQAAIVDAQANGFQVKEEADIKASPDTVWKALGQPAAWWNSEHTFSRDARNLSLELKPGGCLCEKFPNGGGIGHLLVVEARPGAEVIFHGAMGPMTFMGAAGSMVIRMNPLNGGTHLTLTYTVGGYNPGGLDKIAGPADMMLTDLTSRLKGYAEAH